MDYNFYLFLGKYPVRIPKGGHLPNWDSEFYINGKRVKDENKTRDFNDATMDYGDYSVGDYEKKTYDEIKHLI
jgi:hypothetical protein